MSISLLYQLDDNHALGASLLNQRELPLEKGECVVRHFPDGESYLRILTPCKDRDVVLLCSLHQPDKWIMPLLFATQALREQGARRVGLVAPYLAYMRQDKQFHPGEAVSSKYFAKLLSNHVDWLVTVDPHLHRYKQLSEIYTVPHRVVHASGALSDWIAAHVDKPLLIGPDSESEQWVRAVAEQAGAPCVVLEKIRRGDRDVEVSVPNVEKWQGYTPVLIDDMISTGHTLLETVAHVQRANMLPPVCLAVHGLFAEEADKKLLAAGVRALVCSNSVNHAFGKIDLAPLLARAIKEM